MKFLTLTLLPLVLPVITGLLAFVLTQNAKHLWQRLDAQPAPVKQAVALAWSWLLSLLQHAIGSSVCLDGSAVCDPPGVAWSTVVSFALALAVHGATRVRKEA